ncbi:MAG: aminomethyl-transferring glycine dehydrogenase subunit GcvPB [Deltaproteobacteria bacterium]|nr:aminomethyl-transferring glycine dehydrogenase subunit GcvPB [Deltaproteobacteria bacterium]
MVNKEEKLIFERSKKGRTGVEPPCSDVGDAIPEEIIPKGFLRSDIVGFPEVSELDVVRHFTTLSEANFGVDSGFYPLGSCTMKYNPRINEDLARLSGFAALHPYVPEEFAQGALELIYDLEAYLKEITGMAAVTLQPAAGAQGELAGMLIASAYFRDKGEHRSKVIIPDTAHGTNPATANLAGFKVVNLKSGKKGILEARDVAKVVDTDTAAIMITNPNTLGLFEKNIREIAEVVHSKGALLFCDGANMNALMGIMKLGDMGVDMVQLNLHKTFSTPHGGGGPGAGPLGVKENLIPYLPAPRIKKNNEVYSFEEKNTKSIGRLKAFYGNFSIMLRAYAYIQAMGGFGLRKVSESAILSANYIKERLKETYHLPFNVRCMHECVLTDKFQKKYGATTLDIAKRLIDYGFHPPTIYFPLVVDGAMMIEPTETESLEVIDSFISAMEKIAREASEAAELLKNAPSTTKTSRVDETLAARVPKLRWRPKG